VVEVNPVSPDAMFWGNKKRTGLLNMILDNNQNLDDVIVPADGNLPDRLGLGLPTDGQLYAYDALKKAIAQLQQRYDVVILDAAPLLISADAEYFSGFADITLMLIKAMDVRPGELKRAAGILEKANPKAVGFIVTGVQAFGDGGYFADNVKIYNEQQQNRTHLFARYFDHKDS
jgi:succinoglycan biosynthesis transport protein ExoP